MFKKAQAIRISEWHALPEGFSPAEPLYVFTDIHGCLETMTHLLSQKPSDTRLVFLGDAVDRGPQPMEVLTVLMADQGNILLRGNHDAMAWFAQPDVIPSYQGAALDWRNNGGSITRKAFQNALQHGAQRGGIARTVPLLFENYWQNADNWWLSGNLLFVHAGLPAGKGREWLDMNPMEAATRASSPYWWRPAAAGDLYTEPRIVDKKKTFVVSGHTHLPECYARCPFGITLDRSYQCKMAAEIRPAEQGRPARVRFVSTVCAELRLMRNFLAL